MARISVESITAQGITPLHATVRSFPGFILFLGELLRRFDGG
jgi:hypothetical protein